MELSNLLSKIDELKSTIDKLPTIASKDEQRLWKKLRLEWNYNSNHLEGNTLTLGETILLLINGKTTGDHDKREYDEMEAHDVAVAMMKDWATTNVRPLTGSDIRELNKIILVRPFWKDAITSSGQATQKKIIPGQYKTTPNHVLLPNGEKFYYAEPEEVEAKMQDLLDWYRNETTELHPVAVAAMFHYQLVCIHPFDDGNGRVCRLLMNYHLLKEGLPPVIIKSADKKNYLTALNKADAGEQEAFIQYIVEQLMWSLELTLKATRGESIEEEEDWKKRLKVLKKGQKSNDRSLIRVSDDILLERYKDSFKPLFDYLNESLGKAFNELFDRHIINLKIESTNVESISDIASFIKEPKNLQRIHYQFNWKGYLHNGSKSFNCNANISIALNEYNYKLLVNGAQSFLPLKLYSEKIELEEFKQIANHIGATLVQTIESKIQKT